MKLLWQFNDYTKRDFYMRLFFPILFMILTLPIAVLAQSKQPEPPESLANMVERGSQIFYLGQMEGMHGWALIRQGKPEFFYENESRTAMVMGLLFNDDGNMMTLSQLSALHDRVGDDMYASTGGALKSDNNKQITDNVDAPANTQITEAEAPTPTLNRPLTRAERMFTDLLGANWFTMNPEGEYDLFAFIDPNCPHCKELIRDAAIQMTPEGKIRYRIIPVGFQEESLKKAAVLMASANPAERLIAYANGDESQITVPQNINTNAVQNNTSMMLKHNFDVTPIVVYRTKGGIIRLIRGMPQSYDNIRNDIDNN